MKVSVAIAILTREDKFLMQLRDDIPGIAYPGCWGLFGGHVEPGETPEIAVAREILEEINYNCSEFTFFGLDQDEKTVRHIFHAPLTVELSQLVLQEGWDMQLLTPEDIRAGSCYSAKSGDVRLFTPPVLRILHKFLEQV
jgi:8-oxo-dGTP diphosphatase